MERRRSIAAARRGRALDKVRRYRRAARVRAGVAPQQQHHDRGIRHSLRLATLVFIQYGLLASDIRFVSSANYAGIAVTNVCIAINTWYLTRGIIEARTRFDRLCFVAGGTAGALVAVLAT